MATVKGSLTSIGAHAITAATTLAALGFVNPDDVTALVAAIHQFNDGIAQTVGALGKMWIVLGPLAAWLVARLGITSPTMQNLLATLTKMATSGSNAEQLEKQGEMANATARLPKVDAIVAPELAALASTPGNVVSTPAALN